MPICGTSHAILWDIPGLFCGTSQLCLGRPILFYGMSQLCLGHPRLILRDIPVMLGMSQVVLGTSHAIVWDVPVVLELSYIGGTSQASLWDISLVFGILYYFDLKLVMVPHGKQTKPSFGDSHIKSRWAKFRM